MALLCVSTCISLAGSPTNLDLPVFQAIGSGPCSSLILLLNLGPGPETMVRPLMLGDVCSAKDNGACQRHSLMPSLSLTLVPAHPPLSPDPQFMPTHLHHTETALRPPTDFTPITECLQCRATFTTVRGHRRARNQG